MTDLANMVEDSFPKPGKRGTFKNGRLNVTRATIAAVLAVSLLDVAGSHAFAVQCPAKASLYINPDLVPQRPIVTRQQFEMNMANPAVPDAQKKQVWDWYYNQNQPIQFPYRDGVVLVSPHDPCLQQYLGK